MAAEPTRPSPDLIPLRIADYLEPALSRLAEFASLEPGWDSYDAEPISSVALRTARGLLMLAASELRYELNSGAQLSVFPLADGGVQIELTTTSATLEIEVLADGTLESAVSQSDEADEQAVSSRTSADAVLKIIETLIHVATEPTR